MGPERGRRTPGNTALPVEVAGPAKKRPMRSSEEWTAPRAEQRIARKKRQRVDSGREQEKKLEVKDEARAEKDCAPCPAVSGIEGIHWKKNTRTWQVRVASEYQGSSPTLEGAVQILGQALGVAPARKKVQPAQQQRWSRMKVLHSTFRGCLPGDLEAAAMAFTGVLTSLHEDMPQASHRDMFDEDPLWEVLSIQGKTGPWKNALHAAWKNRTSRRPDGREVPPHWIQAAVLLRALESMSGKDFQPWSDSCGRNNQFHSGWLALVRSLGLIEPDPDEAGTYVLGQLGKHFRKSPDMKPAFARLTQMSAGAAALKQAWGQPLESVHDWAESYCRVKGGTGGSCTPPRSLQHSSLEPPTRSARQRFILAAMDVSSRCSHSHRTSAAGSFPGESEGASEPRAPAWPQWPGALELAEICRHVPGPELMDSEAAESQKRQRLHFEGLP